MISWKNFSPSSILLSHSSCSLAGCALAPPEPGPAGNRRIDAGRDLFIFVGQLDMRVEEPPHLVTHSRVRSPRLPPPIGAMFSLRMNPESEVPRNSSRDWVRTASVHTQASKRRGEIAEGQPGLTHSRHNQGVGAIDTFVLTLAVAGVGTGQGTQRQQPRAIKPRSGFASLAPTSCST